tara:strand:+ start:1038 stop:2180 length:1143 start_codon:yes stop_codon:yes gene_type:complete
MSSFSSFAITVAAIICSGEATKKIKMLVFKLALPENYKINILIIRTSSIGDIIFSLPIIPAIKKTYPDSKITWIIEEDYKQLIKNEIFIDAVIFFPKKKLKSLIKKFALLQITRTIFSLRKELQITKYDMVLDLQGLFRTSLLVFLSNSKNKISLGSEFIGKFFFNKIVSRNKSERISSEYYEFAKVLGLDVQQFNPRFTLDPSIKVTSLLPPNIKMNNYFVIFPFTTKDHKHWSSEYWEELINKIDKNTGLKCVVLGNSLNKYQEQLSLRLSHRSVYSLVDKTNLQEAAAVISKAKFCIGVDTGLTHMSVSLSKPTIAIFLSTCPYLDPIEKNIRIIWSIMGNKSKNQDARYKGPHTPVKEVTVETVLKELDMLTKHPG